MGTIVARRDSRNRGFLNPTSIINFRWQLEIIKPKMPSREQLPWKPINSASVYGTNFLNMCTEAVTTTIKRQDQKLKEMSLESVLPPKAAQRAQAAWDKLNAKAWLEQDQQRSSETSETISFYAIQSNDFPLSATVPCRFRLQLRQFVDGRPWILSIRRIFVDHRKRPARRIPLPSHLFRQFGQWCCLCSIPLQQENHELVEIQSVHVPIS